MVSQYDIVLQSRWRKEYYSFHFLNEKYAQSICVHDKAEFCEVVTQLNSITRIARLIKFSHIKKRLELDTVFRSKCILFLGN